jgi:hypothetical protein
MSSQRHAYESRSGWGVGVSIFAASMMLMTGVFGILQGFVAVLDDTFYVKAPNYTYEININGWGWIHIVLGALLVIVGLGVLAGATWARVLGIGVVLLSMIDNFLFLPYYPLWSLLIIAIDAWIVWSLAQTSLKGGI